ncbi:MAG: TlpA family protein disulfide reductase [SAR324 cluster bacterium]|nr:TlpA family protein disulfide reductase [SAR324 cluster bacterium]
MDSRKMEGVDVSILHIENEKGELVPISKFKGKPLILNFWASWCVPCRLELPLLTQIYPSLVENEKQLIGVNMNESWQKIQKFRQKTGMDFPVFRDDGRLAKRLRIQLIPSIVVVDIDGKVQSITSGFRPWIQAYLLWWV